MNLPDSMAKNMTKIAAKLRNSEKNRDCGIGELRLGSNFSRKSCGIAIADSKNSCACPPLRISTHENPRLDDLRGGNIRRNVGHALAHTARGADRTQ